MRDVSVVSYEEELSRGVVRVSPSSPSPRETRSRDPVPGPEARCVRAGNRVFVAQLIHVAAGCYQRNLGYPSLRLVDQARNVFRSSNEAELRRVSRRDSTRGAENETISGTSFEKRDRFAIDAIDEALLSLREHTCAYLPSDVIGKIGRRKCSKNDAIIRKQRVVFV